MKICTNRIAFVTVINRYHWYHGTNDSNSMPLPILPS